MSKVALAVLAAILCRAVRHIRFRHLFGVLVVIGDYLLLDHVVRDPTDSSEASRCHSCWCRVRCRNPRASCSEHDFLGLGKLCAGTEHHTVE